MASRDDPRPAAVRGQGHAALHAVPVRLVGLAAADQPDTIRSTAPPTAEQLGQAVDAAEAAETAGGLEAAVACALAVLAARDPAADPCMPHLARLLDLVGTRLADLPALHDIARLPVPFDDRVAQCFEQVVALMHAQDVQIAELRAIAADLI